MYNTACTVMIETNGVYVIMKNFRYDVKKNNKSTFHATRRLMNNLTVLYKNMCYMPYLFFLVFLKKSFFAGILIVMIHSSRC